MEKVLVSKGSLLQVLFLIKCHQHVEPMMNPIVSLPIFLLSLFPLFHFFSHFSLLSFSKFFSLSVQFCLTRSSLFSHCLIFNLFQLIYLLLIILLSFLSLFSIFFLFFLLLLFSLSPLSFLILRLGTFFEIQKTGLTSSAISLSDSAASWITHQDSWYVFFFFLFPSFHFFSFFLQLLSPRILFPDHLLFL